LLKLEVCANKLSSFGDALTAFPNLGRFNRNRFFQSLLVSSCILPPTSHSTIFRFSSLLWTETLFAAENHLTDLSGLHTCVALQKVDVSFNRLTRFPTEALLPSNASLRRLNLGR
jgi:Leucine-rich repeat (LRR) protein